MLKLLSKETVMEIKDYHSYIRSFFGAKNSKYLRETIYQLKVAKHLSERSITHLRSFEYLINSENFSFSEDDLEKLFDYSRRLDSVTRRFKVAAVHLADTCSIYCMCNDIKGWDTTYKLKKECHSCNPEKPKEEIKKAVF